MSQVNCERSAHHLHVRTSRRRWNHEDRCTHRAGKSLTFDSTSPPPPLGFAIKGGRNIEIVGNSEIILSPPPRLSRPELFCSFAELRSGEISRTGYPQCGISPLHTCAERLSKYSSLRLSPRYESFGRNDESLLCGVKEF